MIKKIKDYFSKSGMFSKIIVIFCIAYSVHIIEWAMDKYEQNPGLEPSTIITAALTLFGGELLFLCLKRIFSNSDKSKDSKIDIISSTLITDEDETANETDTNSSDNVCG